MHAQLKATPPQQVHLMLPLPRTRTRPQATGAHKCPSMQPSYMHKKGQKMNRRGFFSPQPARRGKESAGDSAKLCAGTREAGDGVIGELRPVAPVGKRAPAHLLGPRPASPGWDLQSPWEEASFRSVRVAKSGLTHGAYPEGGTGKIFLQSFPFVSGRRGVGTGNAG